MAKSEEEKLEEEKCKKRMKGIGQNFNSLIYIGGNKVIKVCRKTL